METAPARIIVHVFAKKPLSPDQYKRLRAQTAQTIAAQRCQLVDLVIDTGPPKRDPADHETLRRIARGEADGVAIFTLPLSIAPKKTADVLRSQLSGPFLLLTEEELAERGLLPMASGYSGQRVQHRAPRPLLQSGVSYESCLDFSGS